MDDTLKGYLEVSYQSRIIYTRKELIQIASVGLHCLDRVFQACLDHRCVIRRRIEVPLQLVRGHTVANAIMCNMY